MKTLKKLGRKQKSRGAREKVIKIVAFIGQSTKSLL